jgi:hypothetical protein
MFNQVALKFFIYVIISCLKILINLNHIFNIYKICFHFSLFIYRIIIINFVIINFYLAYNQILNTIYSINHFHFHHYNLVLNLHFKYYFIISTEFFNYAINPKFIIHNIKFFL